MGDNFADVVDTSHVVVDVSIDATDTTLIRVGARGAVKLNSYPHPYFSRQSRCCQPYGSDSERL